MNFALVALRSIYYKQANSPTPQDFILPPKERVFSLLSPLSTAARHCLLHSTAAGKVAAGILFYLCEYSSSNLFCINRLCFGPGRGRESGVKNVTFSPATSLHPACRMASSQTRRSLGLQRSPRITKISL